MLFQRKIFCLLLKKTNTKRGRCLNHSSLGCSSIPTMPWCLNWPQYCYSLDSPTLLSDASFFSCSSFYCDYRQLHHPAANISNKHQDWECILRIYLKSHFDGRNSDRILEIIDSRIHLKCSLFG